MMNPKGIHGSRLAAILLAATFILAGLFVLVQPKGTEAKEADTADGGGYLWTDSLDPEPKVAYDWIDAKLLGNELVDLNTQNSVKQISLPFEFPYYDDVYTDIYVTAWGYLTTEYISYPSTSYSSNIPNGNGQGGQIAVGWCYAYDYYTTGGIYGGVHYYTPPTGEFVCVEWNKNSYGITMEIILYASGLVKLQWKDLGSTDNYKNGYYLVAGIESPDESNGLCYSRYSQANLYNQMAVEFSTNVTEIETMELLDGDASDHHICYAEYDSYEFKAMITTPAGGSDIKSARVLFGNYSDPFTTYRIGVEYRVISGLPTVTLIPGTELFMSIGSFDLQPSMDPFNINLTVLTIEATFFFEFPQTGNMSITVWAAGEYSLPDFEVFEDVLYLDNKVQLVGDLQILGKNDRPIKPKEFAAENETINVTGLTLEYEKHFEGIYPPNASFMMSLKDELDNEVLKDNLSGVQARFEYRMPLDAIKKTFMMILYGIPVKNLLTPLPEFYLFVDNTPPSAPTVMTLRADSRIDPQTLVDNDDTLYLSWSTVTDIGSGVAFYCIYTDYKPDDPNVKKVDTKTTSFVWQGTFPGSFTLVVWAEDFVGHAGQPITRSIIIDKDPIIFSETNLIEGQWLKTLTPEIRITVKDNMTNELAATGVWGESVEYSISTNGTENFREWISADVLENAPQLDVKIRPQFEEGTDNWIRFRAKDVAGNGPVESKRYRLWIDVTEVRYSDIFPTQNVWHDLNVVKNREVEAYMFDGTSGIDTSNIWYRIANATDDDGNPMWITGIAQEGNWVKYSVRQSDRLNGDDTFIHVHFKYDLFVEGSGNVMQFRTNDRALNGKAEGWTMSPYYTVQVNTKPVAAITSPLQDEEFYIDELFTLDASESFDLDIDKNNLRYEWYEGARLIGQGKVLEDYVRLSTLGYHIITLYVSDPVHRYDPITGIDLRSNASVRVRIVDPGAEIDPNMDEDGDGMPNGWEIQYMLDYQWAGDANIDSDGDGYSNLEEYRGTRDYPTPTDPRDPTSYPPGFEIPDNPKAATEAPFSVVLFIVVIVLAVLVAAILVMVSFIRMNRREDREKREETEEEAMLVTPQLDIPTMPVMPMVDTSIPTLPAASATEEKEALPPAPQEMQQPIIGQEAPLPADIPFGTAPVQ